MLIYCAYSNLDEAEPPDWVVKLRDNPTMRASRWTLYEPFHGFAGNVERQARLMAELADPGRLRKPEGDLKLDPMLFEPLTTQVMGRMQAGDGGPTIDVPFKNLYVLLRSDIVLVDLNVPSHGGKAQEVLYAYLLGVPVVGVAHRFILSPWLVEKCKAVVFPKTSDDIVHQVMAFDQWVTAAIQHHSAAAGPASSSDLMGKLEQLQRKLDAMSGGGSDVEGAG